MLIILETSQKEHQIQQCVAMLSRALTPERLHDWGLQARRPVIVANRMIDWALAGDTTVTTVWGQHADNSGDESSGGDASGQA